MAWISEVILTAIRDDRICDCITEDHLVMVTGLEVRQIKDAVLKLRKHLFLEKTAAGCYSLTTTGLAAIISGETKLRSGPTGKWRSGRRIVKNSLRERIWRAIRIRRKFTVPEIISLVVQGDERGDVTSNVQKYIKALNRAGYLSLMPRREPCISSRSPGFKRWWLNNDTGPKAPIWHAAAKKVYDQNTEVEVAI